MLALRSRLEICLTFSLLDNFVISKLIYYKVYTSIDKLDNHVQIFLLPAKYRQ